MKSIKYKYLIASFIMGVAFQTIAAMMKIMHWANANLYLTISFWLIILALILLAVKVLTAKSNFLNK